MVPFRGPYRQERYWRNILPLIIELPSELESSIRADQRLGQGDPHSSTLEEGPVFLGNGTVR